MFLDLLVLVMIKTLQIIFLGLFITSCATPNAWHPNDKHLADLNSDKNNYLRIFVELWHDLDSVKKKAYADMPPGKKSYALSAYFLKSANTNADVTYTNEAWVGYGDTTNEAIQRSIEFCNSDYKIEKSKIYSYRLGNNELDCRTYFAMTFTNEKKSDLEIEIDDYTKRCKDLGFKENEMNECVTNFYMAENKLSLLHELSISEVFITLGILNNNLFRNTTNVRNASNCFLSTVALTGSGGLNNIICN